MISQYDKILPFLADRYSDMPFPDLQWFLSTTGDRRQVIETLRARRPKTLFVDTDIDRPRNHEVVPTAVDSGLHTESLTRIYRLHQLKIVFDAVRQDYELVESGPLISVWARR